MTRARNLANLGNKNAITADIGLFNIGIGSTQPTNYKLDVVGGNAYIGGGVTITGNLSVGGTVTYEDVTNVDSVGIITAAKGFRATAGGIVVTAGVSTFPVIAVSAGTTTKDLLVTGVTTATGAVTANDTLTVAGNVDIADKIIHTGDTNTALRFPANDTVSVETAGSEALRVDASGRLLIGATSELFSQNDKLQIADTSANAGIIVQRAGDNANPPYFHFQKTRNASVGGNTIVQSGDELGRIRWNAANGSGINYAAEIRGYVDGTPGASNDMPGRIAFYTTPDGSGTPVERLRIDSSGRLLQGITSARGNFGNNTSGVEVSKQLEGTNYLTSAMSIIRNSNDGNDGGIILGKTRAGSVGGNTVVQAGDYLGEIMWVGADGTTLLEGARIDAVVESGVGNDDMPTALRFLTNGGSTAPAERLRITKAGNIGIGTEVPDYLMTIGGISGSSKLNLKRTNASANGNAYGSIFFTSETGADVASVRAHRESAADDAYLALSTQATSGSITERFRISSSGNVSIQTNDVGFSGAGTLRINSGSTSGLLTLDGGSTNRGGEIGLYGGSNGGRILFRTGQGSGQQSEKMRLTENGRLLIGGTSSTTVWGYGQGSLQVIGDWQGGSASFINNEANTNSNAITLAKTRNGGIVSNNDTCGALAFSADDGNGYSPCARIMGQVDGAPGDGDMPGRMIFSTTPDGSSSLLERMRIKSDGEILMGTTVDRPIAGQGFNSASGWGGSLQIEKYNPDAGNNAVPFLGITAWNGANETYTGGISFNRSNSNTQGTQGAVTPNQELGNISFNGSDGTNFINGAEIYAIPDATYSTNSAPTALIFATTVTGTSEQNPTARVRINSKGFTGPLARTGAFQGTYVYRQRNQSSDYKHYIRGPLGGYLSSDLTGDNNLAYIQVQCMGTGTDSAWCYYRYSRDASSGASQVVLDHLSGGSSGNSNIPYMQLFNGEAAWLMAHSTQYYVVVRVVCIGGTNEITYSTTGEYGSN